MVDTITRPAQAEIFIASYANEATAVLEPQIGGGWVLRVQGRPGPGIRLAPDVTLAQVAARLERLGDRPRLRLVPDPA